MQTHLQYILPDLWHFGEELQSEYRAYDAEAAQCDATIVAANQPFSSPMTSEQLYIGVVYIVVEDGRKEEGRYVGRVGRPHNFRARPGPMPRTLGWIL